MRGVRQWAIPLLLLVTAAACTDAPANHRPAPTSPPVRSADTQPTRPTGTTSPSVARTPRRRHPNATATASRTTPPRVVRPAAALPPLSARARAAGLVDIRTVVPTAIVDLRYATPHNFVGVRLYPIGARCLVHRSMAPGLRVAAHRLRRAGYRLVFWDCYRPHWAQVRMFRIVPDPNWVARPGPYATSHEAARSVDVTLARMTRGGCPVARRVDGHCLLDMGTGFDDFTPRAHAYATAGLSTVARRNRALLRRAMAAGGLSVYSGEWWHFDGPGAGVPRPHLHVPLR